MTQFLTDYLFDADFSINFSQLTLFIWIKYQLFFWFQRVTVALIFPIFTTDGTSRYVWQDMNCYYSNFLSKVAASDGSAYHFKCNKGYKRYGVRNTHCDGQSWSHGDNTPVCTSRSSSGLD